MPVITKVTTSLTYINHQYEIPESIFIKYFGSFEAFKKDHTDENGMIVESREIYDFLDDLHEEIMNTEDIGFAEIQSEKHDPLMEFFIGNIVKYDRRIQKND